MRHFDTENREIHIASALLSYFEAALSICVTNETSRSGVGIMYCP